MKVLKSQGKLSPGCSAYEVQLMKNNYIIRQEEAGASRFCHHYAGSGDDAEFIEFFDLAFEIITSIFRNYREDRGCDSPVLQASSRSSTWENWFLRDRVPELW